MKKIPFYNPASPFFFHIAVLLLYILIFLKLLLLSPLFLISFIFDILIFSAVYPFFALAMAIVVRKAYIYTYQAPVPEEFVNKLVLHNRYLISVIYIFSFIAGFLEADKIPDTALIHLFLLFVSGLCFLFSLYILPILVRLIILKKASFMFEVIILGIFFLLFLLSLYIIDLIYNHVIIRILYQMFIL